MKSFGSKPWVLPQPVLIIGTYDMYGKPNAMNAAWGGQWDNGEIMISLGSHATTDNLKNNRDLTVAFATTQTPNVNAPLFKEFPMTLECRVKEKLDQSEHGYNLVAQIVNVLCDEKYLAIDGEPDVEKMEIITFDPIHHTYIQLGKKVGNAFADGAQIK